MANMICKFCFNPPSPKSDYLELPCVLPFPRRVTPSLPLFPTHHCQLNSHVCSSGSLLNLCWWLYRAKICHKLPVKRVSVSICIFFMFSTKFQKYAHPVLDTKANVSKKLFNCNLRLYQSQLRFYINMTCFVSMALPVAYAILCKLWSSWQYKGVLVKVWILHKL